MTLKYAKFYFHILHYKKNERKCSEQVDSRIFTNNQIALSVTFDLKKRWKIHITQPIEKYWEITVLKKVKKIQS